MIPAVLKVKLGVNEVIVTVLLNFVALLFISYLLHGPLKAPGFLSYSPNIFPQSELPILLPNTRLSAGILIAAGSAIGVYLLMSKTKIGFEIRSVGANIKGGEVRRHERSEEYPHNNGNKRRTSRYDWRYSCCRGTASPH